MLRLRPPFQKQGIVRSIACALGATPEKKNAILTESLPLFYSYVPLADDAASRNEPRQVFRFA